MNTSEVYLRLEFRCPAPYQDLAIAELAEFGVEGFDQNDQGFLAYIPEKLVGTDTRQAMSEAVSSSDFLCELMSEERIRPRNWNEEWEKSIRSQFIDPFFICPTWVDDAQPEGSIRLTIDPKMAFGTGNHETTRLILRLLPGLGVEGKSVLDVGTGTGILAIAALKLGAVSAFGFDVDEWSFENATENAQRNRVEETLGLALGSFETVPVGSVYEVVIANVNRGILLDLAESITRSVANGGTLVLSGLLHNEENHILADPNYGVLEYVGSHRENDWIAMTFRKA